MYVILCPVVFYLYTCISYMLPTCGLRVCKINAILCHDNNTVKPVLSGHSKIDKTKVLKTDYC